MITSKTKQNQHVPAQFNLESDIANLWLLPDGVQDLLSHDAQKQENLRSALIAQLSLRGYELVCPPMIEFTESLLGNASEDVKRQTFKIIDQLTGRLMGVRADITPQILRIDAQLNKDRSYRHIARYCYAGHVIHTLPDGLFGSRTPLQLGAEIFGHAGTEADIELIDVLYDLLRSMQVADRWHLDLGHVQPFRRLKDMAKLSASDTKTVLTLYANKALPELNQFCQTLPMGADFLALAQYGHDIEALSVNLSETAKTDTTIQTAISELRQLLAHVKTLVGSVSLDMTGLGYHYHTGLVFNAYLTGENQPIARGGRFESRLNQSGFDYGHKDSETIRPATGFSLDVSRLQAFCDTPTQDRILIDYAALQHMDADAAAKLRDTILQLRQAGKCVIKPLTANDGKNEQTHKLMLQSGQWVVCESK